MNMNLENFWDAEKIRSNTKKINKIFFYRICGMGMGTCAILMKEYGKSIAGADNAFFPPMGDYLKDQNIQCHQLSEVSAELLSDYDLVVVGNSVGRNSDDARMLEELGIPFTSFPCLLGELILKDKEVIGISGTHGKTTTTYYLTQMLDHLGLNPGYLVGGVLLDRPPAAIGAGKFFVIESDEYDSAYFQKIAKLRQYNIDQLIITSLEYDHADIYPDMNSIEKEFESILPNVKKIIANSDYESAKNVSEKLGRSEDVLYYGSNSELGPKNIRVENGDTFFDINLNNELYSFQTSVIGTHNIFNLTTCILFCFNNDISYEELKKSVKNLSNVKRRQELRGTYKKSFVIDDFAHHPTSVELTIDAIKKKYPNKKIFTVIEPSTSTSRSAAFQGSFVESFREASAVVVANPQITTNAKQFENLDYELLAKDINKTFNIPTWCTTDLVTLRAHIDKLSDEESVLLIMGNRTILGLWESDFIKEIQ